MVCPVSESICDLARNHALFETRVLNYCAETEFVFPYGQHFGGTLLNCVWTDLYINCATNPYPFVIYVLKKKQQALSLKEMPVWGWAGESKEVSTNLFQLLYVLVKLKKKRACEFLYEMF